MAAAGVPVLNLEVDPRLAEFEEANIAAKDSAHSSVQMTSLAASEMGGSSAMISYRSTCSDCDNTISWVMEHAIDADVDGEEITRACSTDNVEGTAAPHTKEFAEEGATQHKQPQPVQGVERQPTLVGGIMIPRISVSCAQESAAEQLQEEQEEEAAEAEEVASAQSDALQTHPAAALLDAILRDAPEDVSKIIGGDEVDVDAVDIDGRSALMFGCELGRQACIALLLGARADPCRPDGEGVTALHKACLEGYAPCVTLLLEVSDKNPVDLVDEEGSTPLVACSSKGRLPTVFVYTHSLY